MHLPFTVIALPVFYYHVDKFILLIIVLNILCVYGKKNRARGLNMFLVKTGASVNT